MEKADNVDEDIAGEDEESELYRERAYTAKVLTQGFVTCSEKQETIPTGMKKSILHLNAPALAEPLEDNLIEAIKVGYDTAKGNVKTSLFSLIGELIVDFVQQGMMDPLLLRRIEDIIQSGRFMDALRKGKAGCQVPITPMTVQRTCHTRTPVVAEAPEKVLKCHLSIPFGNDEGRNWVFILPTHTKRN